MTKKENFAVIREIVSNLELDEFVTNDGYTTVHTDELLAFIDHEVELLSRKRSASSKPTKRQVENEALKGRIAEVLGDEGMTVTAILGELNEDGLTNQRVSALLRQMVAGGVASKAMVKGKAMFTIA